MTILNHLSRNISVTGLSMALTAALVAGCGQSKVEYLRQADVLVTEENITMSQPPVVLTAPDLSALFEDPREVTHPGLMSRRVAARSMVPFLQTRPYLFQTWSDRAVSVIEHYDDQRSLVLNNTEMDGLGFKVAAPSLGSSERIVSLAAESRNRCVFRNRLLPVEANTSSLSSFERSTFPEAFNSTSLTCVSESVEGVTSGVRLVIRGEPNHSTLLRVRWLGTTAHKVVPRLGNHTAEFRVTHRLAVGQAFDGGVREALDDDFDILLNTYLNRGAATMCGVERNMYLAVEFQDGQPIRASILAKTRNAALSSMQAVVNPGENPQAVPLRSGHVLNSSPTIDAQGLAVCSSQHLAWLACARPTDTSEANPNCDTNVVNAVDKNFRKLLDTRQRGFASDHVFTMTRAQANGEYGVRNLLMWGSSENLANIAQHSSNPLSIEDMQEFYDVISLK